MSRIDYGTVEVDVLEQSYTLVPSLKAMNRIESRYAARGGLAGVIGDAARGHIPLSAEQIAFIIAAGANLGQRQAKDLEEDVFQHGTVHLAPQCVEYLSSLANPTGREIEDTEEDPEPGE